MFRGLSGFIFWLVVIALIALAAKTFYSYQEAKSEAQQRARQEELAKRQAERRARLQSERQLQSRLTSLNEQVDTILKTYAEAPGSLRNAVDWIVTAETNLRNHAYSPFWESIECATQNLNAYRQSIDRLHSMTARYHSDAAALLHESPGAVADLSAYPADVNPQLLSKAGSPVASKVQAVAARAQTDFHFASIFEQRRTTSAVIAGFNSLSQAMTQMGNTIRGSIGELQAEISAGNTRLDTLVVNTDLNRPDYFPTLMSPAGDLREANRALEQIAQSLH